LVIDSGIESWRRALVEVGRYLAAGRLVGSHGGSMSVRRPEGGAQITVTGAMLGRIETRDLVAVGPSGRTLEMAAREPSSTTAVHIAIYGAHPRAQAVIHAQPPHAIARSIATEGNSLHPANFEAQVLLGGGIPIVTVAEHEAPVAIAEALGEHPIAIVRGHGTYALGADPWEALRYTTAAEEAAQILVLAGGAVSSDGTPLRKAALLALERNLYERWQQAIEHVSPMAARADGWTLKDVVAHIAAWQRFAIKRLGAIKDGGGREATDADAFNAKVKADSARQDWVAVQAEAKAAHEAFVRAISETSASVLETDDGLGAFVIAVNGFGHYAEHINDFGRQ
jgi:L-fuculose-phosphate aldolase